MPRASSPEPPRDDRDAWEAWANRERRNRRARERRAEHRDRLRYPPGTAISAEQHANAHFPRPAPFRPWDIHLVLRVQTPDPDTAAAELGALSIAWQPPRLPGDPLPLPAWVPLWDGFTNGVHRGLAALSHPLPAGGFCVELLQLEIQPVPERTITINELARLADVIEMLGAGAVLSAWGGAIAAWQRERYLDVTRVRDTLHAWPAEGTAEP